MAEDWLRGKKFYIDRLDQNRFYHLAPPDIGLGVEKEVGSQLVYKVSHVDKHVCTVAVMSIFPSVFDNCESCGAISFFRDVYECKSGLFGPHSDRGIDARLGRHIESGPPSTRGGGTHTANSPKTWLAQ